VISSIRITFVYNIRFEQVTEDVSQQIEGRWSFCGVFPKKLIDELYLNQHRIKSGKPGGAVWGME
jgi:hypothetical protein